MTHRRSAEMEQPATLQTPKSSPQSSQAQQEISSKGSAARGLATQQEPSQAHTGDLLKGRPASNTTNSKVFSTVF
jgi:hypothetical protein